MKKDAQAPSEPSKYLSAKTLAAYLDISEQAARKIIKGVQKEIGPGKRYVSPYVVAGAERTVRIAAAAAIDFFKYGDALTGPARNQLPPFDWARAEVETGIRRPSASEVDCDAIAQAVMRAMARSAAAPI